MNMRILGLIMIGAGLLLFTYKGITYQTREKVLDLGALQVTQEKTKTFPFSPVVGGMALAGGVVLVWRSTKRAS